LYINDGQGNFTEKIDTPFEGVISGSIAFADVDGDSDPDIIITGRDTSLEEISKLYTNDGQGSFTEKIDTPFEGVFRGSIAFADIDGDNDSDFLITGQSNFGDGISKLYINNGQGNFFEPEGTPFVGVVFSSIAIADIDGDNDQDVLITGANNSLDPITELYTNDGMGDFTQKKGIPFDDVSLSSIAFMDVDGDNDPDVLISGQLNDGDRITKLYTNDGLGTFTEKMGTPFDGASDGSIAFADVDSDNDPDLLITGRNNSGEVIAKLYTNDGLGNFTEKTGTALASIFNGSIAFADVDGDNDPDVLITGQNDFGVRLAKLYINDGQGAFTEKTDTPFEGGTDGSISFADVDADQDQDVLMSWVNVSGERNTKLYINDGLGGFTEEVGTPFEGVAGGSIGFGDMDGDNDPDALITGQNNVGERIAKLYTNDGMGAFTEKPDTPFDGVASGSLALADVDGDNDPDVLITGQNNMANNTSKLYINQGVISSTEDAGVQSKLEFILFPNPLNSNTIYIKYDAGKSGVMEIRVFNINGIQISQQRKFFVAGQRKVSVDIPSLPPGKYFIQMDDGKRKGVASFIIQ
jgi:hypothetical protein